MANQEKDSKQLSGWDKVVAWYASKSYAVGMIYSIGASVVIIGALFKIMHWPGAGIVLTAGMCTEAFLFIIGIFEKPHAVYNWENVFPQVIGHEAAPLDLNGKGNASVSAIDEKDAKALKDSIANVAATANALADLGKLAEGSNKLSLKLESAAEAAEKFAGAQAGVASEADKLGANFGAAAQSVQALKADVDAAAKSQAEAKEGIAAVKENIAALNAAYELNLKAAQASAADAKAMADANAAAAKKIAEANEAAAKSTEAFAAAQAKLAQQVADLNKVYGGMLNALA